MNKTKTSPVFLAQPSAEREWLWTIALLTLLLLMEFVGLDIYLRAGGERLLNPILGVTRNMIIGITWPFSHYQTLNTAQRRILDLEYRYAETSAQLGEMDALKSENEALREMLTARDIKLEERFLTTPIVSYGRPLIAGGTQDGVQVGQMVLIAQTLVGRITGVTPHQAEVGLLSRATTSPILARTESGIEGIVRGDDKRVILTEIPINVEVKVGDRVVTQGQVGVAPDMLIGRVASVTSKPESAVQTAVVEQLVSFYETTIVEIR